MRRPSPTVLAVIVTALAPSTFAQNAPQNPTSTRTPSVDTAGINMAAAAATDERPSATSARPTPTPAPTNLLDRIGSMVEVHGYLRVRPEWMHQFDLGWDDLALRAVSSSVYSQSQLPWVRNPDNGLPNLCPSNTTTTPVGSCTGRTQTMANMRFRINPEIHITDNIAIYSQIDVFDNLILGSTPQGYYTGGQASPWAPIGAFSQTQVTPTEQNSLTPSITVSRAWAEVTNQSLGQIRFGRMPGQWGLGILANAGNGIDSDYQTHSDRIMYAARIRPLHLFLAAFYDFPSTGATSQTLTREAGQGQPIDVSQLDDVNQYGLALGRRVDPAEARQRLSRGQVVVNGGLYGLYRSQALSSEFVGVGTSPTQSVDQRTVGVDTSRESSGIIARNAWAVISDLWLQVLHRNFRFEMEAALIYGSTTLTRAAGTTAASSYDLAQFGGAMEFEYRLLNNRLTLDFRTGFASGDPDVEGLNFQNGFTPPVRGATKAFTTFRFHPDYRIDMILWRQIFRQVSGAYYFRPSVTYAFVNSPGGDRLYGRAAVIYSRASEFLQTRGNDPNLGVELNAEVTYQSNFRDTTLGDRPGAGFFASIQYGVLFPMAGLGPREDERASSTYSGFSFSTAQTLRGVVGVMY